MQRPDNDLGTLIPAAGFGTRVGQPAAKELLPGPDGLPMIEYSLELSWQLGATPVVITRKQKTTLIDYLKEHQKFQNCGRLVLIENSKEWPESLLLAESEWAEKNLLLLPDVTWQPENILHELVAALQDVDLAVATHKVKDPSLWGVVEQQGDTIVFKEKVSADSAALAWGILAFRKSVGRKVFESQLQSTLLRQPVRCSNISAAEFPLTEFEDITRG